MAPSTSLKYPISAPKPKSPPAKMSTVANYQQPFSDSDSDSDQSHSQSLRHSDLSNSIFKSYFDHTNRQFPSAAAPATPADLSKIQSFLTSSSSGALSCLICLERIKPSDPTWSCNSVCFAVFHLHCIQSWARQACDLSAYRASTRLPISADKAAKSATWNCPKCRSEYAKPQIPKSYLCFCGKLENPPSDDPWVLPHSCGEICERPLQHNCGHFCLLLCHPGPCPSCPKLVKSKCFCGKTEDVKRCGFKLFSCNNTCNKLLDCKIHRCRETCHDGDCPPCDARGVYRCNCGREEEERKCCEREFRCENPCEKMLGCGKHVCERGCHSGKCGQCPYQGKRACPCGKRVYEGMACDVAVPLCGGTCDKMLSCGMHRCHERCHRGQCLETCRLVVTKSCRCGGLKKEVPCYQDLACERKCQRVRDCGRHACKRRCCDGECPPCGEICGKRLRCKNHKCPSPCHRGACAPCPLMVTISCACGATHFEVPCGTEMEQKPPKCCKLCDVPPLCRHASFTKPHKCHYGSCPPCRLPCDENYPCGHKCNLRCHGPKPPPKPEFTLKPKKKKGNHQIESTPGSPCPPCPELVWRPCVGQHFGADRMMVCSDRKLFSCDNLCGNPLPCGNHYCTKTCHALKSQSAKPPIQQNAITEPCEECHLPCEKERQPRCQHRCPVPCHPGNCPPCKVLVKRACHCGSMVHVFECIFYNSLSEKEKVAARSCGGSCHRKLPNCTHLCSEICHPGDCPSSDKCSKKVTVRCQCQTLKKEWQCQEVQEAYRKAGREPKEVSKSQFGIGLLPCGSNCKSKVEVVHQESHQRKTQHLEEKEVQTEKQTPKRRKRRDRVQETKQISRVEKFLSMVKWIVLAIVLVVTLATMTYLGYRGILWLSDCMNEMEEQKQRRRYARI